MKPEAWHGLIGILLIAALFSGAGLVAYLLYGPGINIVVPDAVRNFGFETSTTTEEAVESEVLIVSDTSEEPKVALALPPSSVPTPSEVLADQPGAFFQCANEKALKAEFTDGRVRLALSDGRTVSLPQEVSDEGEIRYANADDSFVLRNLEDVVFLEEEGETTYEDCTAE